MWANLLYMLPVASVLSQHETLDDFKMEGDLLEELNRLFIHAKCPSKIKLEKTRLKCTINTIYPKGTNVWTILDSIIQRYHLNAIITIQKEDSIVFILQEGSAWKH